MIPSTVWLLPPRFYLEQCGYGVTMRPAFQHYATGLACSQARFISSRRPAALLHCSCFSERVRDFGGFCIRRLECSRKRANRIDRTARIASIDHQMCNISLCIWGASASGQAPVWNRCCVISFWCARKFPGIFIFWWYHVVLIRAFQCRSYSVWQVAFQSEKVHSLLTTLSGDLWA